VSKLLSSRIDQRRTPANELVGLHQQHEDIAATHKTANASANGSTGLARTSSSDIVLELRSYLEPSDSLVLRLGAIAWPARHLAFGSSLALLSFCGLLLLRKSKQVGAGVIVSRLLAPSPAPHHCVCLSRPFCFVERCRLAGHVAGFHRKPCC
jgi:hypothetical protein